MKQMKNEKKISMRTLNDLSHFDRMKKKQKKFVTITSSTCIHAFVNSRSIQLPPIWSDRDRERERERERELLITNMQIFC
jgi:hypothetical protein